MKIKNNIAEIKPYVPGKLKEGAIKLASNENPLGTSPLAQAALKKAVENVALYPDGGCVKLKERLAQKYLLKPENFILGNGSDEIFIFIAAALLNPGDEMLTSECTFSEYTFAAKLFGATPVYAPMTDDRFQLTAIAKAITPQTKVIFLCNPNNPTGTFFTVKEFEEFMLKVPDDILVVVDEAYYEYVMTEEYPDTITFLPKYKNMLITRTFSKIYGLAGLRVGYAIGDPELINNLNKAREPFNVNSFAQEAALAALDDEEFIWRSLEVNNIGRAFLYEKFSELGLQYCQTEANFIFVRIGRDCLDAFEKLMAMGVTIRPMKGFGVSDAIRVTIGTPEQNSFFIECLKKYLAN